MQTALNVLVIDDSDVDARDTILGIRSVIPKPSITRLKDGEAAMQFIFRHGLFKDRADVQPGLLFLELDVPRVHGLELIHHLRGAATTCEIPLVVFTRNHDPVALEDAYAAGANMYVVKPTDRGEYLNEVVRLVSHWRSDAAS
jgi:two-component system, response regulator